MRRLTACVVAAGLLAASVASEAADRFVNGTSGAAIDIGNNCLASVRPCRTIQRAVDSASDGDVVRIAAGTYDGFMSPLINRPVNITIGTDGSGAVTIVRPLVSLPVLSILWPRPLAYLNQVTGWTVRDLAFAPEDHAQGGVGIVGSAGVHVTDCTFTQSSGAVGVFGASQDVVVDGNVVLDQNGRAFFAGPVTNAAPDRPQRVKFLGNLIDGVHASGTEAAVGIELRDVNQPHVVLNGIMHVEGWAIRLGNSDAAVVNEPLVEFNTVLTSPLAVGSTAVPLAVVAIGVVSNARFASNIFLQDSGVPTYVIEAASLGAGHSQFVTNAYRDGVEPFALIHSGTMQSATSYVEWQRTSGEGTTSLRANTDVLIQRGCTGSTSCYHLSAGSPAINAGTTDPTFPTDVEQQPRDCRSDIGFWESPAGAALCGGNDGGVLTDGAVDAAADAANDAVVTDAPADVAADSGADAGAPVDASQPAPAVIRVHGGSCAVARGEGFAGRRSRPSAWALGALGGVALVRRSRRRRARRR